MSQPIISSLHGDGAFCAHKNLRIGTAALVAVTQSGGPCDIEATCRDCGEVVLLEGATVVRETLAQNDGVEAVDIPFEATPEDDA